MTKRLIQLLIVLLILFGVTLWVRKTEAPEMGSIRVTGQVVCLPHRNTSGPQTLECAIGIRDSTGNYYGLRNMDPPLYDTNSSVVVNGNLEPDATSNYNIVGTIDVTSWIKL
jgi:hypothetical protein